MSGWNAADLERTIDDLPPLSDAVLQMVERISEQGIDCREAELLLWQDPGLAEKILRLANSAFFGFAGEIGSLRHACMVLGSQTLRQLVVAVAAMRQLAPTRESPLEQQQLWLHSMAVGLAAREVARRTGTDPDLASTAGLFHDIGKLALNAFYPADYAKAVALAKSGMLLMEAEAEVLGTGHAEIGARLAEKWRLPAAIVEAVGRHHAPAAAGPVTLTDVVHVADILVRGLEVGDAGDGLIPDLNEAAWARLDISWDSLPAVLDLADSARHLSV